MRKVIPILIFGLLMSLITYGQTYIKLSDAVGLSATGSEIDSLEEQSLLLSEEFDSNLDETNYIKVYDYGYYLHSPLYGETLDEELLAIKSTIASTQPNYLLFAKRLNADGILDKLSVELVFDSEPYSCLDTENINYYLQKISNEKIEKYQDNSIYELEILILKEANRIISSGFCCSFYSAELKDDKTGKLRTGEVCVDFLAVDKAYNALAADTSLLEYLMDLDSVIKAEVLLLLGCPVEFQKPKGNNGLIPYCVWKDEVVTVPFIGTPNVSPDKSFVSGMVDGAYSDLIGIEELVLSLPDLANRLQDFMVDVISYRIFCVTHFQLSQTEMKVLVSKLQLDPIFYNAQNLEKFNSFLGWLESYLEAYIVKQATGKSCAELKKTVNTLDSYLEFATNIDSLSIAAKELYIKMDTTISNINITKNEDRYYIGYYGYYALTAFYQGTKTVAKTASNVLKKLGDMTDSMKKAFGKNVAKEVAGKVLERIRKKQWFKNMDDATQDQFIVDFGEDLKKLMYFEGSPSAIKAWKDLWVRNVPDFLRTNTKFLSRLSDNPNLVNFIDNLTASGKTDLANNADLWIKRYDARAPLKNGNYNEAINILEGTVGSSEVYNGANYVGKLNTLQSPDAIIATPASLQSIVNSTTDVSAIANKLGVNQNAVQGAKQHLFVTEHLIETAPGVFTQGRFTTFDHVTQWWNSAANGTITSADANSLRKLLGHEYIESALMQQGVVYRQLDIPSAGKYGAHELSVGEGTGNFAHWANGLDRNAPSISLSSDLSNIDNVVDQIKIIEGL